MKKMLKNFGIIAIVAIIGFSIVVCDNGNGACRHIWVNGDIINGAACETAGSQIQICLKCYTAMAKTINALGHDWSWNTYISGSGLRECQRSNCTVTAGIGHTGPAGGIIFYNTEFDFFTGTTAGDTTTVKRYYLEAALANMATLLMWATGTSDLIPGLSQASDDQTDWVIGRGRLNTAIIIARGVSQLYTTPAASACADLRTGDKDDWFLPSRNELNALAQIRGLHGIPNIGWFWSSSQLDSDFAWGRIFGGGLQGDGYKVYDFIVRAVRAF